MKKIFPSFFDVHLYPPLWKRFLHPWMAIIYLVSCDGICWKDMTEVLKTFVVSRIDRFKLLGVDFVL